MVVKKCKHAAGLTGAARQRAWRRCGCSWFASLTVNGRREYVNLGRDEAAANLRWLTLQLDVAKGRTVRKRLGREFASVADDYMAAIASAPAARPNRVRTTRSRVERVKEWWKDIAVQAITVETVRQFIDDCTGRYAPNTCIALYSTFRAIMAHAQDHGLIQALPLPARSRIRKVGVRAPNHLDVPTLERVIAALPVPYGAMAELSLLTGLRIGEVAALRWDAVDFDANVIHVRGTLHHDGTIGPPKTHHGKRVVTISPKAVHLLLDRAHEPAKGELVFPIPSIAMAGFVMRSTLKRLGLHRPGLGWHALRQAHATILEASGLSIRETAARLGHGPNFSQSLSYGWLAEAAVVDVEAGIERLRHAASRSRAR